MTKDKKELQVMVYMGSYIKDRDEGKYNDYVTYDNNCEISYKIYMDLKTEEIYNIQIDKCKEFEREHVVINMNVNVYNLNEYLSSYRKLRTWFLERLTTTSEEDIVTELTQTNELKLSGEKGNSLKLSRI